MKKIIIPIVCLLSILGVLLNINKITDTLANILSRKNEPKLVLNNHYYKDYEFAYVNNAKSFIPYGKQDLLNIIYTFINNSVENFTFYCPKEYTSCIEDIQDFTNDDDLLTHINNFVHPYNSVKTVETIVSDSGEVNMSAIYLYSKDEIKQIDEEVDKIMKEIITDDLKTDYDKIKVVHDYIINKTKYDLEEKDETKSYIAYGALFNHLATCNGYTDLMAIFLTKMGYANFKVATADILTENADGHVWNAVKINDEWLHLDLTWDDPVDKKNGKDLLYHKYFLIDSESLKIADSNITSRDHEFDPSIYLELKTSNAS